MGTDHLKKYQFKKGASPKGGMATSLKGAEPKAPMAPKAIVKLDIIKAVPKKAAAPKRAMHQGAMPKARITASGSTAFDHKRSVSPFERVANKAKRK